MHFRLNILLALAVASVSLPSARAQFVEPPGFSGRASTGPANPVELLPPTELADSELYRPPLSRRQNRFAANHPAWSIAPEIDSARFRAELGGHRPPFPAATENTHHRRIDATHATTRQATGPTWLTDLVVDDSGPSLPGDRTPMPERVVPPSPAVAPDGNSDPNAEGDNEPLPPLAEELWWHGGSYLYEPEGDRLGWPPEVEDVHVDSLRLPESWQKPRPLTAFQEFLGADPIHPRPGLKWFGDDGFQWEPRFVAYGSYEVFGIAVEDGDRRTDGVGHQALIDLDLRLTGTERFHVQFRPLGEKNSGGSFYQINDPSGYRDNSTGVPDRWWLEGEVFSIFRSLFDDEFKPRDYQFVVGKFPFALHNNLLMNDDIIGIAVNKNTLLAAPLSNLNVQLFYGLDDVDGFGGAHLDVAGIHATADYRLALLEATFASATGSGPADIDAYYTAFSGTQFFGPVTLAARVLSKWEDAGRRGDGQLYVLESNLRRVLPHSIECATGIEHAVLYLNAFKATSGWNSISGGNFDRLRSTFEVNPLVQISRGERVDDTAGVSVGVQLFRHHEDESITPEVVWEETGGEAIFGGGVRYQRKIGRRTYIQLQGIRTFSDNDTLERKGVFFSTFFIL